MKLIVHIGQGKAGSTAIQRSLSAERSALLEKRVLYPENLYIKNCQHYFGPLHFDNTGRNSSVTNRMGFSHNAAKSAALEEWTNFERQLQYLKPDTTIISSEVLFRDYNAAEAERARAHLGSLGAETRILAYLRSPVSRYVSLVQQRLKTSRYLLQPAATAIVKVLDCYNDIFSVPCELRVFERSLLKDGDAVVDFVEWSGLEDLGVSVSKADFNASMSAEAMSVMSRMAADHPPSSPETLKEKRVLQSSVEKFDKQMSSPTRASITDEVSDYLMRVNAELLILRDQYGIVFADVDYSIVGQTSGLKMPRIEKVEDLCRFDSERRDELQAAVVERLAKKKTRAAKSAMKTTRKPTMVERLFGSVKN